MNANELLNQLRADPAFATKYGGLKSIDELKAQLTLDGYDLSTNEIEAGLNQLKAKAGELSDADLASVTGGADGGDKVGWYKKTCPKCGAPTKIDSDNLYLTWYCTKCDAAGSVPFMDK